MNEDYTKLRDFALLPELRHKNERRLADNLLNKVGLYAVGIIVLVLKIFGMI